MNQFYYYLFIIIGYELFTCIYCNLDDLFFQETIRRDKNTKFVIFGSRHGNRNPARLLNESHDLYGFEGPMELTAFGKRQSYAFGRELRSFLQGFLSGNYIKNEAQFYTSSASRTQMTLQAILAGLYPPRSFAVWNLALDWTPVPYTIDDPMLRMFSVICPESHNVWDPINKEELETMISEKKSNEKLLNYISINTGWEPSLSSAADLADNLDQFELHNFSFPDWLDVTNFTISENDTVADEVKKLQEFPQVQCANYIPCRNLMSGVWLQNLADTLIQISNSTNDEEIIPSKLVGFVSHTEIVLSVLLELEINISKIETAGGFIIEIRDEPSWEARILLHEPLAIDEHVIFKADYSDKLRNISNEDDWIPIDDLINIIKKSAISNWPVACGIQTENTENVPSGADNLIVDVLEVSKTEKEKLNMNNISSTTIISIPILVLIQFFF